MKKLFKKIIYIVLIINAAILLLLAGTYIYNSVSLKKEKALLEHQGQYVEVDGHNMNLLIQGEGEKTLVFLAGAGTPSPILDFKPLTDRLKDMYKIVIIEKFGYGYSDEIEGERTVGILLEQDRKALQKTGITGPYILCPHSASGFEAMLWAETYPQEVEAIIGLDMGVPEEYDYMGVDWDTIKPIDPKAAAKEEEFYNFMVYKAGLMRYMNAGDIFPALLSKDLTEKEKEQYKALMYTKYAMGSDSTLTHEQWITERFIREMKGIHDGPIPNVPTLLFVSNDEMMTKMVQSTENWKKIHENYLSQVSQGKLIELDCGHYVHIEKPEEIKEDIIDFIQMLEEK